MTKAGIKSFSVRQYELLNEQVRAIAKKNGISCTDGEIENTAYFWYYRLTALRVMEAWGVDTGDRLFSGETVGLRGLLEEKCRSLSELMPCAFDSAGELELQLMPEEMAEQGGLIAELRELFSDEEIRGEVQLMSWFCQFWNSSKKERINLGLKRGSRITHEDIPAATQIFTPEWIVRYLVQNTLGRMWAGSENGTAMPGWEYYIKSGESSGDRISPKQLTVLDPCMGSGNMLLYAFDLLMDIYLSCGYSEKAAARSIIENNLFGLELDRRAYQIAIFSVLLKASAYDETILTNGVKPNFAYFPELTGERAKKLPDEVRESLKEFVDCPSAGSLVRVAVDTPVYTGDSVEAHELLRAHKILAGQYSAVVTNPPYMGAADMSSSLLEYVKKYYHNFRADLFSAFIYRCAELVQPGGMTGFLTPIVWMFIQSYSKLRLWLFGTKTLTSLVQFEYSAFDDATVPLCAFTVSDTSTGETGVYIRLTDFRGGMEVQRTMTLKAVADRKCGYVYEADSRRFMEIPGAPAAYWVSGRVFELYLTYPPLSSISAPRKGNSTSDNSRFLRKWFEVGIDGINRGCKKIVREETRIKRWFPYNKGGGYRKWYGFNDYIIDWYDDAAEIRSIPSSVIANYNYFMLPGLTWSTLTSGRFSIRWFDEGYIFDNGGCCIFDTGEKREYICALLNSKVFAYVFSELNPTLNYQSGDVARFPFIYRPSERIDELAKECVRLSKEDYDSFETSMDFKKNPLI